MTGAASGHLTAWRGGVRMGRRRFPSGCRYCTLSKRCSRTVELRGLEPLTFSLRRHCVHLVRREHRVIDVACCSGRGALGATWGHTWGTRWRLSRPGSDPQPLQQLTTHRRQRRPRRRQCQQRVSRFDAGALPGWLPYIQVRLILIDEELGDAARRAHHACLYHLANSSTSSRATSSRY